MAGTAPADPGPAPTGRGLVVAPFRGLRYAPDHVSDLADVTSPPYDVIDAESAARLAALEPHNVVRLILPRDEHDGRPGGRYRQAAQLLDRWIDQGVLRPDETPAVYVYEQATTTGRLQRGLLGAVELREPDEHVILPHEDVMPVPVADRLELMRATSANLEPILLVYDGGGDARTIIDEVAGTAPLVEASTSDGTRHRLWAVDDPERLARIAADLAPRQALIADGHHRYATYRRLQAEHRRAGRGPGPWDYGLALLVDAGAYPLAVAAIHRVVEDLALGDALTAVTDCFTVTAAGTSLDDGLAALSAATGRHVFLISDGVDFWLLSDPDPARVEAALPPHHSPLWRGLDASVLHALVLERLWKVEDGSRRTRYVHDPTGAVRAAARSGGTAVLLRAVRVSDVHAIAAAGERMPRKSTSFGPKPRTGFVLRRLTA